jgi:hypothetical protein
VAGGAGVASLVSAIMRWIAGVLMAQLALIKPQCRTFMKPEGRTCCRNLRIHSKTSSGVVRGRALPGVRYVHVTIGSWSEIRRRLELATLQTEGARDCQDVAP